MYCYWFYKIENLINEKKYIGLTTNITRREIRHFTDLNTGRHHNSFLQKEYNQYGRENFSFSVFFQVDNLSIPEASQLEIKLISLFDCYKNGYNQNPGGLGGHTGATNGGSHLTETDIYAINSVLEFVSRPGTVLSNIFHVTNTTISRIKKEESHFQYTKKYKEMDESKRKEIFNIFVESTNFLHKKNKSTVMPQGKRKLNEFQVHCILANEEKGRIVPLKRLARYFGVRGNVLSEIIHNKSYRDYYDTYKELSNKNKENMASFLREQEKQTSRIAGTSLRSTNHNITEKIV